MRKFRFTALAGAVALGPLLAAGLPETTLTAAAADGFKLIVHVSNPTTELVPDRVSELFLKRVDAWRNDQPVAAVDLVESSQVRQAFSRRIHGKEAKAVKSYWSRQVFAGKAVPPPEVASDSEVLQFVRTNPGAIGYVAADTELPSDVRELAVAGGGPAGGVVREPPMRLRSVPPEYPDRARRHRITGTVMIEATVSTDGRVRRCRVTKGLGFGLDEAAVLAVKRWRYRPATRNGQPVDATISVSVNFELDD